MFTQPKLKVIGVNSPSRLLRHILKSDGITEFDNLFEELGDMFNPSKSNPSVNVLETDTAIKLEVALPGMSKNDIEIAVEDDVLSISSKNQSEKTEDEKGYVRKEFSFKSFSRSFALPENVDKKMITSKFENGILTVTIPKAVPAAPSKTTINVD